jgi:hypothetical protein
MPADAGWPAVFAFTIAEFLSDTRSTGFSPEPAHSRFGYRHKSEFAQSEHSEELELVPPVMDEACVTHITYQRSHLPLISRHAKTGDTHMRKIILVAAMLLASASAQAAGPRSLTLASAELDPTTQTTTTTAPQATQTAKPADAPKNVDRPSPVSTTPAATTTTSAPATTPAPAAVTTKPAPKVTATVSKPKPKTYWTEGRIISELHRHGIYW